jgi:hypothetical protein
VKIALVALPEPEDTPVAPPLPLVYAAAILEQQRHIVRIYDLALGEATSPAEALAPLRTFRPHVVAVAAADPRTTATINTALCSYGATVLHLGAALRTFTPDQTIASVLWRLDEQPAAADDQNLIFSTLLALDDELDALPFPARHLLPLEQYPLCTLTGELQTTLLAGQIASAGEIIPRNPALVIAELHSIAREHGIHHALFLDPPLTHDLAWLREMLYDLVAADLGIGWEGAVRHQHLTADLLALFRRAGCEALCFQFNAVEVLDSRDERAALSGLVACAHELGMRVRAHIELAPPYGAITALVDMSATFGLDDARFSLRQRAAVHEQAEAERPETSDVAEMAHLRYRSRRRRQLFIQRFGPQLGPMLWRAGQAGLLGRAWQYYADGAADRVPV